MEFGFLLVNIQLGNKQHGTGLLLSDYQSSHRFYTPENR